MKAERPVEGSARLDISMLGDIALVLDASESAWKYQGVVLQLGGELIEKLPAGVGKRLYFLGSASEYDCRQFSQQGVVWWRDNCRRASFIKPIAERLKESRMVVIGSGEIYDLEDWESIGSRLLLANVGDAPLRGNSETGREVEHPDIAGLLPLVHDPIEIIEIGGTGFMPYYWTNNEYKLSLGESVTLKASRPQNPAVAVSFWGSDVRARIQRSASEECIPLSSAGVEREEAWDTLNEKESGIVREAVRSGEFTCPVCAKRHPASELRCHEGYSILGDPVYASFGSRKGFVILKLAESVLYRFHPVNAIRLGDTRAGVASPGGASVFEYDPDRRWVERGELEPYYPVGDQFVLAL